MKVLEKIFVNKAQEKIKSQITGTLIYPVLVLVLVLSVDLGLLIFIVPQFKEMFDDMGAKPALTTFMLFFQVWLRAFNFLFLILIFICSYLFTNYYRTKSGRLNIDKLILNPLFGDLILRSEVASFVILYVH